MSDNGGGRQGLAVVGVEGFGNAGEGGWRALRGEGLGGGVAGQRGRRDAAGGLAAAHFCVALCAELGAQAV